MTITISTKESIFLSVVGLLLIALGISVFAFRGGPTETSQPRQEAGPVKASALDQETVAGDLLKNVQTTPGLPWQPCWRHVNSGPNSNVFNGSNPYSSVLNLGGIVFSDVNWSALQDINGDNLPDWIWTYQNGNTSQYACVYLNNGNGWTKAFECRAAYGYDQTGQLISQTYWGDCAQF